MSLEYELYGWLDTNKPSGTLGHHNILITLQGPIDFYVTWQEMNLINKHQMTLGLLAP